jgi:hypothetical protein
MAWCPFAVHRPLSENHLQGAITPRAVILHTAVSSSNSLFDFFQNNSDLESHFYVTEEGVIEQYMDTGIRADANKNANSFAVSIETEDGREIRPWTPPQLAALVRLVAWLCDTHKIPKRQILTADGSGIGWHVMFGAPGPWTPVSKSCPGAPRIAQTRDTLIPAVANGTSVPTGDDDMQLTDTLPWWNDANNKPRQATVAQSLASAVGHAEYIEKQLAALSASVSGLTAAVAAATKDPGISLDAVRQIVTDAVKQNIQITGELRVGPNAS